MRDPHVDWLVYRLECGPTTTFPAAPPIEHDAVAFRMTLCDGQIKFELKDHYPTVESAQQSISGFLRAWEIEAGLTIGAGEIRFVYDHARLTERNPIAGEPLEIGLDLRGKLGLSASATVAREFYPQPPKGFVVSPTVETLWQRYEGYVARREPLPSMAYFCLTVIESSVVQRNGKRKVAAAKFNIQLDVLSKLGEITERRGELTTARKMVATLIPHTAKEVEWIEAVIKAVIRRVAEVEAGASGPAITMSDFPAI